jgi:hypothetical protein
VGCAAPHTVQGFSPFFNVGELRPDGPRPAGSYNREFFHHVCALDSWQQGAARCGCRGGRAGGVVLEPAGLVGSAAYPPAGGQAAYHTDASAGGPVQAGWQLWRQQLLMVMLLLLSAPERAQQQGPSWA